MELKDKIKELRIQNCLTQEQLAEQLSVSRQTISKYELGINEPNIEILKKMCVIFNCEISDLIAVNEKDKEERANRTNFILISVIISFLIYGFFVVLVFIRFLPDTIPMHYDINFIPDRYGSKYELLLVSLFMLLPLIFVIINGFLRNDYFKEFGFKNMKIIFNVIALIIEIVFITIMIIICSVSLEEPLKYVTNIVTTLMGGLLLILAVFSSPFYNKKPNLFFGYRSKFALKDKDNWFKINTFQSIGVAMSSILIIILGLTIINEYSLLFTLLIIVSVIATFIFEQILKKKHNKH